jgi:hypothetical protein
VTTLEALGLNASLPASYVQSPNAAAPYQHSYPILYPVPQPGQAGL